MAKKTDFEFDSKSESKRTVVTGWLKEDGSLTFKVARDGSTVHVFDYPKED